MTDWEKFWNWEADLWPHLSHNEIAKMHPAHRVEYQRKAERPTNSKKKRIKSKRKAKE